MLMRMRQATCLLEFTEQWDRQGKVHINTNDAIQVLQRRQVLNSLLGTEEEANIFANEEVRTASLKQRQFTR